MKIFRKNSIFLCIVMFVLLSAMQSFGNRLSEDGYENDRGPRKFANPFASRANAEIHMDENPPYITVKYVEEKYPYERYENITFQDKGDYWVIDKLHKGTIFTVPDGYRVRCISFHTKAVSGGAGKQTGGSRVIYSGGTKVKYNYSSELYVYKN